MSRRVFTIQLKLDLDDELQRYEPMLEVVKRTAVELLSTAMLLNDGVRKPDVVVFTENSFHTSEEIQISLDE
jgi:hypothetical protein